MGIRNLCLTERKIKIGQGFQSGNWGDQARFESQSDVIPTEVYDQLL